METTLHYLADPSDLSGTGYGCIPDDPFFLHMWQKIGYPGKSTSDGDKVPRIQQGRGRRKVEMGRKKLGFPYTLAMVQSTAPMYVSTNRVVSSGMTLSTGKKLPILQCAGKM